MPGLVRPGNHVFVSKLKKDVDGRDKPGHDEKRDSLSGLQEEAENAGCFFSQVLGMSG
jgi:hypothetical protein